MSKTLQSKWLEVCDDYITAFCEKHSYILDYDCWVTNNPGTIACINDMFVSMEDIRYDIDNDIPEEVFEKWYWKSVEVYELTEQKYMNFPSYCKGAPDEWPEERLQRVREQKERIEEEKRKLEEMINNFKTDY